MSFYLDGDNDGIADFCYLADRDIWIKRQTEPIWDRLSVPPEDEKELAPYLKHLW